jgi:hypothetical protein
VLLLQGATFVQPGGLSGELRTVDGVPAIGVRVVAMPRPPTQVNPDDGPNYFVLAPPTGIALTDNEGKFLFRDLAPGRYYLMAGVPGEATFYPGAADIRGGEVLDVTSGNIVENLNFPLVNRLGGRLSGRVRADMKVLGPRTATIIGGRLEDLIEVPVRPDGTWEFGHIPPGRYLVSLYPPTSGIASIPVNMENNDITGIELVPLPTKAVRGRIAVKNGPIPHGLLGFYTEKSWVGGKINTDGTFEVQLHATRHQIDFAGLPVGYSLASVTIGGKDATAQGITVGNADVTNVVITLNAPRKLAVVRGNVTGLAASRFPATQVQLEGPIFNPLLADINPDGTFEFPSVTPGLYRLTLKGVPELAPMTVVVAGFDTFNVAVAVPPR